MGQLGTSPPPVHGHSWTAVLVLLSVLVLSSSLGALISSAGILPTTSLPAPGAIVGGAGPLVLTESRATPATSIPFVLSQVPVGAVPEGAFLDTANGDLYVADTGSDSVSVISTASGQVVANVSLAGSPSWFQSSPLDAANGDLYVGLSGTTSVQVISTVTNTLVATVPVGSNPQQVLVDPLNGDIYVTNEGSANVSVISGASNTVVANLATGSQPDAPVLDTQSGDIYVSNHGAATVSVISGSSNTVSGTVSVGSAPYTAVYDPANECVYVGNALGNTVSVINGSTVVSSIPLTYPAAMLFDPMNGDIYVAGWSPYTMNVVSGLSNSVVATYAVGTQPLGGALIPGVGEVLDPNYGSANASVTNTSTNSLAGTIPLGSDPYSATYDPANSATYITESGSKEVGVLVNGPQAADWNVSSTLDLCNNTVRPGNWQPSGCSSIAPNGVAYDSGKGELFVSNSQSDNVSVISDTTDRVLASVPVGSNPQGVAYDAGMNEVFVANYVSSNVSIISDSTNMVVATVPVGNHPIGLTYDSGKGEVFVANSNPGTVSVISDSTNTVVTTIPVGTNPVAAVYDSGMGEVFVANCACSSGSGTVSVISDSTNTVVATVSVGALPYNLAYDSGLGEIFVANSHSNYVSVISDSTNAVVASVQMGAGTAGEAYDPSLGEMLVALVGSDVVSAISDDRNTVVSNVSVGSVPEGVAYDSAKGEFLVTDDGQGTVSNLYLGPVVGEPSISSFTATPSSVSLGASTRLTTSASGGVGTLSYEYTGLPPGCTSADASSLPCTPTAAGSFGVTVFVNDTLHDSVNATATVTVVAGPALSVSPSSLPVGYTGTFTTSPGAGVPPFHYQYTGLPSGCPSLNTSSLPCTPTAPGTFTVRVYVNNSAGELGTATAPFTVTTATSSPIRWTNVTGSFLNAPPSGSAIVWDAKDGYLMAFGGTSGSTTLNQTWVLSGDRWDLLSTPVAPSPRGDPEMVYDAADGYVLLFGGEVANGCGGTCDLGDTWTFTGGVWTELNPTTSPSARSSFGFVYDAADGYVVLESGCSSSGCPLTDTWEFRAGSWTELSPSTSPPGRCLYNEGPAWDGQDGYAVLTGGGNCYASGFFGDTWTFVGGQWTQLSPTATPPARTSISLVYDPVAQAVLSYGGNLRPGGSQEYTGTWAFAGGTWTNETGSLSTSPPGFGADGGYGVYDPGLSATLFFWPTQVWSADGPVQPSSGLSLVSFTASPSTLGLGSSTNLTATTQGGTGVLSYTYTGLPTGCSSGNLSKLHCTPDSVGSYDVRVIVNDTSGDSATATVLLTVQAAPALSSVTVAPGSATLGETSSTSFTASPVCSGGTCPTGTTYAWSVTNGLGILSAPTGAMVTFTAGAVAGSDTLFVNATLDNRTVRSAPVVATITSPSGTLESVAVSPSSDTLVEGGAASFTATPECSGGSCSEAPSYAWSLTNGDGQLSASTGGTVTFTAGSTAGSETIFVNATLNGVTKEGAGVEVTITSTSSTPTLTSVAISPSASTLSAGASQEFAAAPTCSSSPCPASVAYSWSLSSALGTLNATTTAWTSFTAGSSAGQTTLSLTARWDGKTAFANATISIAVPAPATPATGLLGLTDVEWGVLGAGVAVVILVALALGLASRRRRDLVSSAGPTGESVSDELPPATSKTAPSSASSASAVLPESALVSPPVGPSVTLPPVATDVPTVISVKKCEKCGALNDGDADFCNDCGTRL